MTTKRKAAPAKAPKVEKRRVTMESAVILSDNTTGIVTATDYVPVDMLDEYVTDAQTRWQRVTVDNSKHDPGPGGDDGPTHRPGPKK